MVFYSILFDSSSMNRMQAEVKPCKAEIRKGKNESSIRAPDNFLKQGVADASLGAKGVFLQNPEVFSLPSFYTLAFLEFGNLV